MALEGASGSVGLKCERIAFLSGGVRSSGWEMLDVRHRAVARDARPYRCASHCAVARDARPYHCASHCAVARDARPYLLRLCRLLPLALPVPSFRSRGKKEGALFSRVPSEALEKPCVNPRERYAPRSGAFSASSGTHVNFPGFRRANRCVERNDS